MALFEVAPRAGRLQDSKVAQKANAKSRAATVKVKDGGGISGRISLITAMVEKNLGQYAEESVVLRDEQSLHDYISACIENGFIAIDTETTGLDPMLDDIVGVCIYTPGQKTAYIPISHVSYVTLSLVPNQLSKILVKQELDRLKEAQTKVIMFNAKFDIRVLRNQLSVYLNCYWDCYLAARLLNENEGSGNNGLKKLHQKYVLDGVGDAFSFGSLFDGIPFSYIPIKVGYLYAAHDAKITYELFKFQEEYLGANAEKHGLQDVAWVFHNVEMPCVEVVCNMEDNGITFDFEYAKVLSKKYHLLLEDKVASFYDICDKYAKTIDAWTAKHPNHKLSNPINIASSTQIATLLYDVLGIEPPDPKNPRGTGVEILSKIDNPLCKAILDYREVSKLLSTYIDKLPECVNPNDGRIHCSFNQYGADTGRFSSSDPNLQNIPSHNKDIRKMFTASEGYVLMSSDFSQQEPKCLAALCRKQGDPQMYNTFMEGKDLYSEIASKAFGYPYEDCKEFREDGSTNKEGKERRSQAKKILLGVLYGRGVPSVAEQLGTTTEEAYEIKESVFRGFPAIREFEQNSLDMAHNYGFVTTVCGRKRRLPDLQLDEFEFRWRDGFVPEGDILDFDDVVEDVPQSRINYYMRKLSNCRFNQKRTIFEEANEEGIWIVDNGKKIGDSTRQCVNARIQGSAADLTKIAMVELNRNQRLKELGFRILIPVHDEIIAECPEEHAFECSELLAETMSKAAEDILEMPIKCDVEITRQWYGETITGEQLKERESYTSHQLDVESSRGIET